MVGTAQARLYPPYKRKRPRRMPEPSSCLDVVSADDVTEIGAAFLRQHDHLGADTDAGIEVSDVFIGEADAARRDAGADGCGSVGAVDAVDGAAEIHGAGAERI